VSVGPWVVGEDVTRPGALLESLAAQVGDPRLRLGVLEANLKAVVLVRSFHFAESPDPPWRMVLGPSAHLGASDQCYAIGSAAKG
jgi:hypothetical protein